MNTATCDLVVGAYPSCLPEVTRAGLSHAPHGVQAFCAARSLVVCPLTSSSLRCRPLAKRENSSFVCCVKLHRNSRCADSRRPNGCELSVTAAAVPVSNLERISCNVDDAIRSSGTSSRTRQSIVSLPGRGGARMTPNSTTRVDEGETVSSSRENDLLIIGPGVLGSLVGQLWQEVFPDSYVMGQTNTTASHDRLRSIGIQPITKAEARVDETFPFVIFCAPPSGSEDYAGEVRTAASRWSGTGSLLFTSSSAVYDVADGGLCDEDAPVLPKESSSPRVARLLDSEEAVLSVGGNVVRMAGLYTTERGAHAYWMNKGPLQQRPDYVLNLISYEDAADLCVKIMQKKTRERVFMGCDGSPVTTQEVMDAVLRSGVVEGEFGGFVGKQGPQGKRMQNDTTRESLGWTPKYPSFVAYIERAVKV